MQGMDGMFYLLRIDISQESQTARIDTQDGNLLLANHAGGAQKSSVTSHRNGKVDFKLVVVKDVNPFQRHLLPLGDEGIELSFDEHFCLIL